MFPDLARDDVFRLETSRLWLRWPRAQDAAFIAQEAADVRIARNAFGIPHPYPEGAAAEFILTARKGNSDGLQLVLVLAPRELPGRPIGSIGLRPIRPDAAQLCFWLAHSYWGRGLATEAVRSFAGLVFSLTEFDEILAMARADNPAARRVLEKSGFVAASSRSADTRMRGDASEPARFRLDRRRTSYGRTRALSRSH